MKTLLDLFRVEQHFKSHATGFTKFTIDGKPGWVYVSFWDKRTEIRNVYFYHAVHKNTFLEVGRSFDVDAGMCDVRCAMTSILYCSVGFWTRLITRHRVFVLYRDSVDSVLNWAWPAGSLRPSGRRLI